MFECLAEIYPLDVDSGERVAVRVSTSSSPRVNAFNGQIWEPAMVGPPSLGIKVFDGDFSGAVEPAGAALQINMEVVTQTFADADAYMWIGAPIRIYAEESEAAWPWTARFTGIVRSIARRAQVLTLQAEVDEDTLSANVLTATYAGTGDDEGGDDLRNKLKPLVIGWAKNVEPILINAVDSVYQFSGYGAIEEVTKLYERGSDFGASIGDHDTYEMLVGASIAPGQWGTCLAEGMIRLGAPAYGVITGDVKGHAGAGGTTPRLTGDVIQLAASIAGVSSERLDNDTLDRLDILVPYPINIVITEQVSFLDLAKALALPCNTQAGIDLNGKLFVCRIALAERESVVMDAQGRALPQVKESTESDVSYPYYRTVFGANRCWRTHSPDEIATLATLVEKGTYDATETYREGNITSKSDGSRWLYTNPTPTSGNAPPDWPTTSNSYWENLSGPLEASSLTYADGTPIEDLKPAQAGADVTSANTAAAIVSQGDLATQNEVDLGTQVTGYLPFGYVANVKDAVQFPCSDETTALTTGTAKVTFRMPFAMSLTEVRASLSTAQTSGSIFTVDVNEGGSSILSTKITIDNGERTSKTAATLPVISDAVLDDDAEITVDIDQIGDGTAKGLKITLIGYIS